MSDDITQDEIERRVRELQDKAWRVYLEQKERQRYAHDKLRDEAERRHAEMREERETGNDERS
jgi:hypothetical protein